MEYTFAYASALMICFLLTTILFLFHIRYWNANSAVPLACSYLLTMVCALSDVIWIFIDGQPRFTVLNYLLNIVEYNCFGLCGFFWYLYCCQYFRFPAWKTKTAKMLMALPALAVMGLIISSPVTGWVFFVDDRGFYQRGPYFFFQQVGYFYLIVTTVLAICSQKKCATSSERRHLSVLAMFALPPTLLGVAQLSFPVGMVPTLQFSMFISLMLVFIDELELKITRDSLTQLMNRYEFERILQAKMDGHLQYGPKLYVMMGDLDDFKSINDTYGHQQGDTALQITGIALSNVSRRFGAISARMSGDEFIALLECDDFDAVDDFLGDVQQELEDVCQHLPYKLRLSIGVAEYNGNMTMMQLLDMADKKMYTIKNSHKEIRTR